MKKLLLLNFLFFSFWATAEINHEVKSKCLVKMIDAHKKSVEAAMKSTDKQITYCEENFSPNSSAWSDCVIKSQTNFMRSTVDAKNRLTEANATCTELSDL